MSLPPRIETERLQLRPSTAADAAAVFRGWAGVPESCRWLDWGPHGSAEATAAWLDELAADRRSGAAVDWIAVGRASGEVIGAVRLAWHSSLQRDIGFCVARRHEGVGHAREMVAAVTERALALPGVVRVQATCHPDNAASLRVLASCGYELEGRLRRCRLFPNLGDEPQDLLLLARLR